MAFTKNGTIVDSRRLKRLRLRQFLTMAELGRMAGLSATTIKRLETEGRAVNEATLRKTLKALGLGLPEARSMGLYGPGKGKDERVVLAVVDWAWADGFDGRTKAHMAACLGKLPPGFDRWDLRDEDGWTVAHEAAFYGHLPKGFRRWDLRDRDGLTVAHVAAQRGVLPTGFKRWDLADKNGRTVRQVADERAKGGE